MIKDMMETSEHIQKSLPRDDEPFQRILGKLSKRCSRETKGKQTLSLCARENLKTIEDTFKTDIAGKEFFGKSVLLPHLDQLKSKTSCTYRALLLDRMLNITETIFQEMRKKAENEEVKTSLTDLMDEVKMLRHKYSEEQKVWKELQDIHSIENTKGPEWLGKSVFASYLDQLNSKDSCSCEALLLERMLKIYEDIFQDMLNKSEEKEVKASLNTVMNEMHKLKHKYSEEQKVWSELQDIHSVKVKNGTVQGGALNDFLMVFKRAYTEKHQ
ncbi:interferon gamma [Labeo rohita]|uniref:Interferon gamma n=1 Tax=Labeo rohita TaxID=84645 RepID=A0A498MLY6_LABRO|nr:interferon gamma [Labeo rohita]